MKKILFLTTILILGAFSSYATTVNGIIPKPRRAEQRDGVFTILTTTQITHYSDLRPSALYLAEYLPLQVREYNAECSGNIVLKVDKNLAAEEYVLEVSATGIIIDGGSAAGVHNGIETLLQLIQPQIFSHTLHLPTPVVCCLIEDEPRFAYRGFMLDVVRTWMNVDELKRFIANLAHHKINKLHLHLTDDEGWRLELKSYPELTRKGAFRGPGSVVAARYGSFDKLYGGFYTQEQMRDIIEYAAQRNIEIIPEIDLPGHSHTLLRVMPEMLCNYQPDMSASHGYDTRDVLCLASEDNYRILERIIEEVASIFPSPYIHIGGDEFFTSQDEHCPDCKALMKRYGYTSIKEAQGYFSKRMADIVQKYGKKVAAWDEASRGNTLPKESLICSWKSNKATREILQMGYKTIITPGDAFYFDMRQSPSEPGHDWAAVFDVKKTLSYNIDTQGFSDEDMSRVVGFEGAFFSEVYLSHRDADYDYIYHLTYPRICALSEVAWSGKGSWNSFYPTMRDYHYDRMEAMGIEFRLFPPEITYEDGVLTAENSEGGEVFYSVVGKQGEHRYTKPLETATPERYVFHVRRGGAFSPEAAVSEYFMLLKPKFTITSSIPESNRYKFSGVETYSRLSRTARAGKQGDWVLYTFHEPIKCRKMRICTGNVQTPRYLFNAGYLEVSYDGENFERVGDLEHGCCTIENPSRAIKAVRVVCTQTGNGARFVTLRIPQIWPEL